MAIIIKGKTVYGPSIVRDGLVLYLDAANIKCFRGEPTTNLDLLTNSNYYNRANSYGSYCTITNGYYHGKDCYKIVFNLPNGTNLAAWKGAYFNLTTSNLSSLGFVNNDCVTRSFDVYIESMNDSGNYYPRLSIEGTSINKTYNNIDKSLIGVWQRVSCTSQIVDITQTNNYLFYIHANNAGLTTYDSVFTIYMCNAQLENKDHSTPYTSTSRGTTVATGGGLIDLSNNGNHGEIVNNILYDSNNCGSLKFDATNAYINVSNLSSITNGTISFWSKMDDTSNWLFMTGQTINYYILATSGLGNFYHSNIGNNTLINYVDGLVNNTPPSDLGWHYITLTGVNLSSWTIFNIGIYSGTSFKYNGKMSNIMFYNRALSDSEVLQNYNALKSRFI